MYTFVRGSPSVFEPKVWQNPPIVSGEYSRQVHCLLWISLAMVCYEGSSLFCILFLIFSRCVATLPHQTCTWLSLWTVSVASPQILNGQRVDIQPHSPLSFVFHPSCLLVHLTPSSQHPSLTGCRVVLGLTLLCFVVSVWLDLQWPPDLAGGSPPPTLLVQIG